MVETLDITGKKHIVLLPVFKKFTNKVKSYKCFNKLVQLCLLLQFFVSG